MIAIGHQLSHSAINRVDYHGWRDCYVMTNGIVEAVVVPAIGRVMQFRFVGQDGGVFWENRELDGMRAQSGSEWMNFGGDKAWPAPQEDWQRVAGRSWPPPAMFDSVSMTARIQEHELILSSPVDRSYGVQVLRHIAMRSGASVMSVTTRYCKVSGPAVDVGVWVVTQLRDPLRVFALLPEEPDSFRQITDQAPMGLRKDGRLLSFRRDPTHNIKIASDGSSVLWMDDEYVLLIDGYSASSTDNRCTTAVYTNMDPMQYVELETEGGVEQLSIGEHLDLTNTYTLAHRSVKDETAAAHRSFGLGLS
jgi:hypothetical protein